jgi:hypothetical protein
VIAIGAVGLAVFRPSPITGPGVVTPSESPSSAPSGSPPPALTERFDSTVHGISVSYPAGWTLEPATLPWQTGVPGEVDGVRDTIADGASGASFLGLASQRLGSRTGERWMNDLLADPEGFCQPPTESINVAGSPGVLAQCSDADANGLLALVWGPDRGYWIVSYRIDDRAWFDQVLASVELRPADAVVPSPPPALTETFSSPTNAIALSYPTGWRVEPATSEWTTGIPLQGDPFRDLISDPARENTFLLIASQKLGLRSGEQFITETATNPAWGDGPCQPTTESVPINGIMGSLVTHCDGTLTAVASHGDRGYLFVLFGLDDAAWFREILASAQMG